MIAVDETAVIDQNASQAELHEANKLPRSYEPHQLN
jgi:hypothetical protein